VKPIVINHDEWYAEGVKRYGPDLDDWKFVCPICGHVAKRTDWQDIGAPPGAIAFSCIGRWMLNCRKAFGGEGKGPCDYAGGGLFPVNPIIVIDDLGPHEVMDFAVDPLQDENIRAEGS